ncbi:MAG: PIN domain-containing protein [Candidatus Thiodiazotropha taylori]
MAGFKQIKIFTDTNIVHAAQAHLLVSNAVYKYVSEHKEIESVELKWFIPSMVVEERRHQMLSAALALSPKITEVEKLLGHSLALTPEIMEDRVNSKISRAIEELGLEVCELDLSSMNWHEIIERSAKRKAPFEISSDKEKGFRDAIIANTFIQEVGRSPKTPRACLLVFITGDKRLREYIEEGTADSGNVRILETLEELKSLLNAIASEVTEDFLVKILPEARDVFWNFDKKDGLYKKDEIFSKISEQYESELESVKSDFPGCIRQSGTVTLGEQTFIKKTGQTITWSRTVSIAFKLAKYDFEKTKEKTGLLGLSLSDPTIIATGQSFFSVIWQHQVSTKGNIIKPKVVRIDFVENIFDDEIQI